MLMRMLRAAKDDPSLVFLFVVLTASLSLNVVLGTRLAASRTPAGASDHSGAVKKGANLASIPILDRTGQARLLRLDSQRPTIVYVVAPGCRWCARNLANIQAIAAGRSAQYAFIGLSNRQTGLAEDAASLSLPFPVYALDNGALERAGGSEAVIQFNATPQTLVVRSDGIVDRVWRGAIGDDKADVERFFGLVLPGLVVAPPRVDSETARIH